MRIANPNETSFVTDGMSSCVYLGRRKDKCFWQGLNQSFQFEHALGDLSVKHDTDGTIKISNTEAMGPDLISVYLWFWLLRLSDNDGWKKNRHCSQHIVHKLQPIISLHASSPVLSPIRNLHPMCLTYTDITSWSGPLWLESGRRILLRVPRMRNPIV